MDSLEFFRQASFFPEDEFGVLIATDGVDFPVEDLFTFLNCLTTFVGVLKLMSSYRILIGPFDRGIFQLSESLRF